jgi:hypothetical protein
LAGILSRLSAWLTDLVVIGLVAGWLAALVWKPKDDPAGFYRSLAVLLRNSQELWNGIS